MLNCSKCGYTRHRAGFNLPTSRFQCKNCKENGHFTSKCFNLNTKEVQANLLVVDVLEAYQLQSFSQYLCAIQNFINECPSVDNVNNESDGCESFSIYQILQDQSTTSLQEKRLYADLFVSTNTHSKPLYLRWKFDTSSDVNVMPGSVYKKLSHNYSLLKLWPIQANVRVYNSTVMNVIGSCVLYHYAHKSTQALTFIIIDIEACVLLSCVDTLALGLLQAHGKLDKRFSEVPDL